MSAPTLVPPRTWHILAGIALGIAACFVSVAEALPASREWRFAVLLDGKPIGYHHFALQEHDGSRELQSKARFSVKVLFIEAYSYAHDAHESWQGDCLAALEARTDDDGETKVVTGRRLDAAFAVAVNDRRDQLDACVMTFAYWNPNILHATRLLNPQTGEYIDVAVEPLGSDSIRVRGIQQITDRYRLVGSSRQGEPLRIDLWYSPEKEWLALESTTSGRRLRYQIQ